jgi:hypothetical protein
MRMFSEKGVRSTSIIQKGRDLCTTHIALLSHNQNISSVIQACGFYV